MISFNKPYLTGKEVHYMYQSVYDGHISGNGYFTKQCDQFFENRWGIKKCLLTTSCTDALEMCAILLDLKQGDEVIVPSYTFVSTALAFVRQGARIVFADSSPDIPNIDVTTLEPLITPRTKVIIPVHYAGIACDMDIIMDIANRHKLFVVEDAAQAIDSFYNGKPLAGIGHMSCFSFHETKNIQCGEGGMLVINDDNYIKRAEIIWEKGTNRAEFFRGEVNKYGWVDIGSSFLPSDIQAAFLYAQIEEINNIQSKRKKVWNWYYEKLSILESNKYLTLPKIPAYATNNGHMFYAVCRSLEERQNLISFLKQNEINAVFHYQSLHKSPYYKNKHDGRNLIFSDLYEERLVRLPFFYKITEKDIEYITGKIIDFFSK